MIIVWIILSLANAFIAGMHYSMIMINRQDGKTTPMMQYVIIAVCMIVSIFLQISIVGRASHI